MKKKFLLIALIGFASVWAYGQDSSEGEAKFDKWSIEGAVGLTKPWQNFDAGYRAGTPDFLATDFGLRYMFNEYLGARLGFGYNQFTEGDDSFDFETNSYRFDLQGVVNLGRIMKFETWTKTFGLLGHAGVGVGYMDYKRTNISEDWTGNVLGGLTGQIKLGRSVALTLDGTVVGTVRQQQGFDGGVGNSKDAGMYLNGTVGLAFYLGKNKEHADWYLRESDKYGALDSKVAALDQRVKKLEDTSADKASVAKTQGDVDALAKKVDGLGTYKPEPQSYDEFVKQLVNDGFVNVYFDFNSTKVQGTSTNSLNFMKSYLAKNKGASVEVQGYADELGSDEYNNKLSQKRADAVAKLLTQAGIDGSRLSAVGKGKDTSVDKSSEQARQLARRATFVIK
ncbi:MAG: OmpA family protein [Mangrovibacterium sp.]